MTQNNLDELRNSLNSLDKELIAILERRAGIAQQIGSAKREAGIDQGFSPVREAEVFKLLRQVSLQNLPLYGLEKIFSEVVSACRAVQNDTHLCVLGEKHGWINDGALARYGHSARYSAAENFEDFISSVCRVSTNLGFVSFSPQHSIDLLLLVETLFSGKLSIVEEFTAVPEFSVVSNSARDLSEVHEICVTSEMLQLMRSYFISLSFDLKIKICRSMSEAYENLQSINPVAAILPTTLVKHNPDLRLIKEGLRSDSIGSVKFLTLSPQPIEDYRPGLKTTLLCAVNHTGDRLYDIMATLRQYSLKVSDVHSLKYSGKPWETILIIEHLVPETREKFDSMLKELATKCLLARSCGFYPVFRQDKDQNK